MSLGGRKAIAHLERDPAMARVIDKVGPCRAELRDQGTHFHSVLRAIVFQQLSGKAAATIHGRVEAIYGGRGPLPHELLATEDATLRAAGLSRQKLGYLRDLAAKAALLDDLHELPDEEIIARLTQVKGVGVWSAQMFLMFRLGRPDVLAAGDLGIQKGVQKAYRLRSRPTPKRVLAIGEKWRPYATTACWYLWRSLD
jgi:DNA-3-methyladenine glycosylase II